MHKPESQWYWLPKLPAATHTQVHRASHQACLSRLLCAYVTMRSAASVASEKPIVECT